MIEARAAAVGAELKREFEAFEVDRRLMAVGGQSLRGTRTARDLRRSVRSAVRRARGAQRGRRDRGGRGAARAQALDVGRRARAALVGLTSPGRLEVSAARRWSILDGAHNPGRRRGAGRGDARVLHVGAAAPGAWPSARTRTSTASSGRSRPSPTSRTPRATRASAPARPSRSRSGSRADGTPVEVFDGVREALAAALATAGPGDCVLVTGSLYTVADARRALA